MEDLAVASQPLLQSWGGGLSWLTFMAEPDPTLLYQTLSLLVGNAWAKLRQNSLACIHMGAMAWVSAQRELTSANLYTVLSVQVSMENPNKSSQV